MRTPHHSDALAAALAEVPLDDRPIRFDRMIARSPAMKQVFRRIVMAADSSVPVLLHGETGTGKDLVARSIHDRSRRRGGPFIAVNVGAIPNDLVQSELFGHERGAFTGAGERRKGRFELSDRGTLFLDEVTTMDERTQVALLRVLESEEFYRVGGTTPISCSVRIIAATNADVSRLVEEGRFRAALLYRLDVFAIRLPALRERPGATALLATEFLDAYKDSYRLPVRGIEGEALRMLERYRWPGNVRELKNVIQRAVLLCRHGVVSPAHLPARIVHSEPDPDRFEFPIGRPLADLTRSYMRRTLAAEHGNKARTARLLGISRKALYAHLKEKGRK